ncbi:hypothetical protein FQN49_003185 [Arthroderma sp. PD_2]|nr:hypothetical protein FQN49_003185 [Arthroderma sp. PD_2]
MSSTSKIILGKVRKIVPPMLEKFHKGCDMSHVICEPSAATVIKTYSPNLMVHPILQSTSSVQDGSSNNISHHVKPILDFLPRLHVLVIGPGLGRDPLTQKITAEVIKEARKQEIALVMDADALLLVQNDPKLIHGYKECLLTPNVVEFARLSKSVGLDPPSSDGKAGGTSQDEAKSEACEKLSRALGGVLIIQKGAHDVISNGDVSIISDVEGGKKRSGGQGDTLTGSLGTFMAWRKAYHDGLWEDGSSPSNDKSSESGNDADVVKKELYGEDADGDKKMSRKTTLLLAAWAGSAITRECSRRAFLAKGRSMQAGDLTEEVHGSFMDLIGEKQEDGSKL